MDWAHSPLVNAREYLANANIYNPTTNNRQPLNTLLIIGTEYRVRNNGITRLMAPAAIPSLLIRLIFSTCHPVAHGHPSCNIMSLLSVYMYMLAAIKARLNTVLRPIVPGVSRLLLLYKNITKNKKQINSRTRRELLSLKRVGRWLRPG